MEKNELIEAGKSIKADPGLLDRIIENIDKKGTLFAKQTNNYAMKKIAVLSAAVILIIATITVSSLGLYQKNDNQAVVIPNSSISESIDKQESNVAIIENSESSTQNSIAEIVDISEDSQPQLISSVVSDYSEPVGDWLVCCHYDDYHIYSFELVDFVGEDKVMEWIEKREPAVPTDECPAPKANLYEFINKFKIPRAELEKLNYTNNSCYLFYWDLDALYASTPDIADKAYRQIDYIKNIMEQREGEMQIKGDVFKKYIGDSKGGYLLTSKSIAELVYEFNIPREELEQTIDKYSTGYSETKVFTYNLSLIYNKDSAILEALEKVKKGELYPVQVDEMIRVNAPN